MSLVPFLLNELLEDYRRPTVSDLFDQNFGLVHDPMERQLTSLLTGPLRSGYLRPWRGGPAGDSGTSSLVNDKNEFKVNLDVQQFKPEELKVKVEDGYLVVDGKHEERSDEHGFISRQFTRRYKVPKDVDPNALVSKLSSDGVLSLQAPKKSVESSDVREIPITHTNAPLRVKDKKAGKDQETMEQN